MPSSISLCRCTCCTYNDIPFLAMSGDSDICMPQAQFAFYIDIDFCRFNVFASFEAFQLIRINISGAIVTKVSIQIAAWEYLVYSSTHFGSVKVLRATDAGWEKKNFQCGHTILLVVDPVLILDSEGFGNKIQCIPVWRNALIYYLCFARHRVL